MTDVVAQEMEVPQVHSLKGLYYLVSCTISELLAPGFMAKHPGHRFHRSDYAMVGSSPLGPFQMHGTGEIVPLGAPERPYAGQLVLWKGEWHYLGTCALSRTGQGSDYVTDPSRVVADESGLHVIA